MTLPLFLPLAVSVAAGEAVAGEASIGTLRNLLVVPVSRTRLLVVKYVGITAFAIAAAFTVAIAGLLIGLALFPIGPVTLLSGGTLPVGTAIVRVALVALYVAAMLAGLAAIGLFASTLTEVPIAAMAVTAITALVGADPRPGAADLRDPPLPVHGLVAAVRRPAAGPGGVRRHGAGAPRHGGLRGRLRLAGLGAADVEGRVVLTMGDMGPERFAVVPDLGRGRAARHRP